MSVDSVTRESSRAFIPVAREPKKPSARHVSTQEKATLAGLLQQKHSVALKLRAKMKQDNNKNSYNAVPDAGAKTTSTGRRVVLAAALSFCL